MNPVNVVASWGVCIVLAMTIAGLIRRGRLGLCWAFPVYAAGVLVTDFLMVAWPERYYAPWFYTLKQSWLDVAKLVLAIELAYRTFRAFPGAMARARIVLAVVLALTAIALIGFPVGLRYEEWGTRYAPRIQMGTAWVLTATALLVTWYRLPVRPLHRAVAFGLTAYLFVFTTSWGLVSPSAIKLWAPWINPLAGLSYLGVASWWAYVAWRPEERLAISRRTADLMGLEDAA